MKLTCQPNVGTRDLLAMTLLMLLVPGLAACLVRGAGGGGGGGGGQAPQEAVDFGGLSGSQWDVEFAQEISATVSINGQLSSSSGTLLGPPLAFDGFIINLSQFCFRADAICPHQLLPEISTITQPDASQLEVITITVARRGPFLLLQSDTVLGELRSGGELRIPLAFAANSAGICFPIEESAVRAVYQGDTVKRDGGTGPDAGPDAAVDAGDGGLSPDAGTIKVPTRIEGEVALVYTGTCLTIGGSANLPVNAVAELSVSFTATRR